MDYVLTGLNRAIDCLRLAVSATWQCKLYLILLSRNGLGSQSATSMWEWNMLGPVNCSFSCLYCILLVCFSCKSTVFMLEGLIMIAIDLRINCVFCVLNCDFKAKAVAQGTIITSPVGVVAKYCDEYVCVSVCLTVCLQAYLQNHTGDLYEFFCACCLWPWLSSGRVTKSKGEGAVLGVFFPIDNAL